MSTFRSSLLFCMLAGVLLFAACATDEPIVDNGDNDEANPSATVQLSPTTAPGSNVSGEVTITQEDESMLRLAGTVTGLAEGQHGFHLHADGSCDAADSDNDGEDEPAAAAGPHYDADDGPDSAHGAPDDAPDVRHFGDFGNVTANADGEATFDFTVERSEGIEFDTDVVGRALMVHEDRDDLESDPGGNAGTRFGCGVISQ